MPISIVPIITPCCISSPDLPNCPAGYSFILILFSGSDSISSLNRSAAFPQGCARGSSNAKRSSTGFSLANKGAHKIPHMDNIINKIANFFIT